MSSATGPRSEPGPNAVEEALERRILDLLDRREAGRTICPSDAARAVFADLHPPEETADADGWRALMEPARRAAGRLVERGQVVVTQRGEAVDLATARGPIRLRRAD